MGIRRTMIQNFGALICFEQREIHLAGTFASFAMAGFGWPWTADRGSHGRGPRFDPLCAHQKHNKINNLVSISRRLCPGNLRVELHFVVMLARMQRVEIRDTVDAEHHRLAVDHELPMAVLQRRLNNPRIAAGPVVAATKPRSEVPPSPSGHQTFNHGVGGSSPPALTKQDQKLSPKIENPPKVLCMHCVCKSVAAGN